MPNPTNCAPLQHEIGLEKGNGVNVALLPHPASEAALGAAQCRESAERSTNGRAAVAARPRIALDWSAGWFSSPSRTRKKARMTIHNTTGNTAHSTNCHR